jgi:predicted dehydrogenase
MTIKVGIIGANPDRGWAAMAHVPALQASPDFRLTAVCTSRIDSARAAAEKFGAAQAFADPQELSSHPEVDLVVVASSCRSTARPHARRAVLVPR